MLKFDAESFITSLERLQFSITWANREEPLEKMGEGNHEAIKGFLNEVYEKCCQMGFNVSAALIEDAMIRFSMPNFPLTHQAAEEEVKALQRAVHAELKAASFLRLPVNSVHYYDDRPQFGEDVATKFAKAVTDVQEAGKCFATGRYTACVFHLMRVMEFATQFLGKKLNIALVSEKNWANILDQVDKAIKALPLKNSSQKAKRNRLSEASAHLRMVKDAWRNDVMHPKETYTEEEAERVFRNVKDFMVHLATKL